jgi:D-glycero-D-manno-heptose 1,7-bisphosphate phosphatase
MTARLRLGGARVDGIFYCPHDPAEGCDCRKPAPGLLLQAADALDLDLSRSVFVGDAATDVAAGQRVNCRTILVRTGRGVETEEALAHSTLPQPTYVAPDLLAAVPFIKSLVSDPTTAQEAAPLVLRAEGVGHEATAFAVAATD